MGPKSGSGFPKLTLKTIWQAKVRGNKQLWYVDSCCLSQLTGEKSNFFSLTPSDGGSVAFGNYKFGMIVGIGKIGESPSHSIDNVYLVDGLQHNLLSVS